MTREIKPMSAEEIAKLKAAIEKRWNEKPHYQGGDDPMSSPGCMMRAQEILALIAAAEARYLEIDDGMLVYREGDLSISAFCDTVIVNHAGSGNPAAKVPLNYGAVHDAIDRPSSVTPPPQSQTMDDIHREQLDRPRLKPASPQTNLEAVAWRVKTTTGYTYHGDIRLARIRSAQIGEPYEALAVIPSPQPREEGSA